MAKIIMPDEPEREPELPLEAHRDLPLPDAGRHAARRVDVGERG